MLLANPVDELADAGVGQAAGRLGDLGHLVEQTAARGRRDRLAVASVVGPSVDCGRGLDLGVFLGLQLFLGEAWRGRRRCRRRR